jgi:Spy/CpxP family protein refolding chaperone
MSNRQWTYGTCVLAAALAGGYTPAVQAAAPTSQNAQAGMPRGHGARLAAFKAAVAKLDLTADQQTKIDGILADAKAQLQALRGQARTGDRTALRDKVRTILRDTHDKLAAVLTPEQKARLRELLKEHRQSEKAATSPGV